MKLAGARHPYLVDNGTKHKANGRYTTGGRFDQYGIELKIALRRSRTNMFVDYYVHDKTVRAEPRHIRKPGNRARSQHCRQQGR